MYNIYNPIVLWSHCYTMAITYNYNPIVQQPHLYKMYNPTCNQLKLINDYNSI